MKSIMLPIEHILYQADEKFNNRSPNGVKVFKPKLIYFEFDISKPKSNSHAAHKVPIQSYSLCDMDYM